MAGACPHRSPTRPRCASGAGGSLHGPAPSRSDLTPRRGWVSRVDGDLDGDDAAGGDDGPGGADFAVAGVGELEDRDGVAGRGQVVDGERAVRPDGDPTASWAPMSTSASYWGESVLMSVPAGAVMWPTIRPVGWSSRPVPSERDHELCRAGRRAGSRSWRPHRVRRSRWTSSTRLSMTLTLDVGHPRRAGWSGRPGHRRSAPGGRALGFRPADLANGDRGGSSTSARMAASWTAGRP